MKLINLSLVTFVFAMASTPDSLSATILVDTSFSDAAQPSASGFYTYGANGANTSWITNSGAPAGRNYEGSSAFTTLIRSFTPTTLDTIGESLSLTFTFASGYNNNDPGAYTMQARLYDIGSQISANNFGGTNPLTGKNGIGFTQVNGASTTTLQNIVSGTASNLGSNTTVSNYGFAGGTPGLTTYELNAAFTPAGLQLNATVGGVLMTSHTISGSSFTFDAFTIHAPYTYNNAQRFRDANLGSVHITAIPEPSAVALTSLAGCLLLLLRRRKTKS